MLQLQHISVTCLDHTLVIIHKQIHVLRIIVAIITTLYLNELKQDIGYQVIKTLNAYISLSSGMSPSAVVCSLPQYNEQHGTITSTLGDLEFSRIPLFNCKMLCGAKVGLTGSMCWLQSFVDGMSIA